MDPFATLGIARTFDVDLAAVEKTHRELSRALHPDKYVGSGASERRESLSKAVEVNESWRVVRDPVRRAEALFVLAGIAVGERSEPAPAQELLMEMMDQREELAEAKARKDLPAVHAMARAIEDRAAEVERALGAGFANGSDRESLAPLVVRLGELRYYRRFLEEVSAIEDALDG